MKKTKKMFEVEEKIGESIEDYLKREYETKYRLPYEIAEDLGIGRSAVNRWLGLVGIHTRSGSEAQLPPNFKKPSKEELKLWYVNENKTIREIANKIGINTRTVRKLLIQNKIATRDKSECKLPPNFKKPSKEELKLWYVNENKTPGMIGENLEVSSQAIRTWLKEYEIPIRDKSECRLPKGFVKPTKEELHQWYVNENKSSEEIAMNLGVESTTIRRWLDKNDIPLRDSGYSWPPGFKKPSKEELNQLYIIERVSAKGVAKRFGVSDSSIREWLKEYEIPIRDKSECRLPKGFVKPTKEELHQWYVNEGKSTIKIAKELGIGHAVVGKWLREYKIRVDSIDETYIEQLTKQSIDNKSIQHAYQSMKQAGINDLVVLSCLSDIMVSKNPELMKKKFAISQKLGEHFISTGNGGAVEYNPVTTIRALEDILNGYEMLQNLPDNVESTLVEALKFTYHEKYRDSKTSLCKIIDQDIGKTKLDDMKRILRKVKDFYFFKENILQDTYNEDIHDSVRSMKVGKLEL